MAKILYIINPVGNGGAGVKVWHKFRDLWGEDINEKDIIFTERPLHGVDIASKAEGYSIIVAVGGDGTVNEVMQGVLKNRSQPSLGIIPAGTGNDIARNVRIESMEDAINALKKNQSNNYDLLKTEYAQETKYSFLTSNFGFSANHRIKPWMKRIFGATIAYYLATMLEMALFIAWEMKIEWENGSYSGKTTMVIVTNVEKTSGGSMILGKGATPVDGKMTITIIPFKSKFNCLFNEFPKLPKGKVEHIPGAKFFQTTQITVDSDPPTDMDIDGDNHGSTPATVEISPLSIKIISLVK
jgi:YegS/Rv2252/BmrU family lipid kinase